MITFDQEKRAKEELVGFLRYALLFLSDNQEPVLEKLVSGLRNEFDAELAENQIWEIHPSDLESTELYGSKLHTKIRAIQYWDQCYVPNCTKIDLYFPCLVTAIDSLLNNLIKSFCIDETPLEVSRLLRESIGTAGQSSSRPSSGFYQVQRPIVSGNPTA